MKKHGFCKEHRRKHPCLSCRASLAGSVMTPKKRLANKKNGRIGAANRWKGHVSQAALLAKRLGISRQAAYYRLKRAEASPAQSI